MLINVTEVIRDKAMFNCSICKFDCSSKEDMIYHLNSQPHKDNTEAYQLGNKNKMVDNLFFKKSNVQEGTDSDMSVQKKYSGYFGSDETLFDFNKKSKDNDVQVNGPIRYEVVNKNNDEASQISAPRITLMKCRDFLGISDNSQAQEKTEKIGDNLNFTKSLSNKAVPRKVSKSQTSCDKDNTTQNNSSSNLNNGESEPNVEEVLITNFEQSTSNIALPSQSTNCLQRDKSSNTFTEHFNGTQETKVDEELFDNKYKNSTTTDLINSMGQVYKDLGAKKKELFELKKDIKKYDGEFRYLYKKISENYQKNI
uniref:C2H2-type domain-containing protein n=1 Tax=Strongyloides papillosus TaxID=174720 RepID=A0A0N5BSA2_STREA